MGDPLGIALNIPTRIFTVLRMIFKIRSYQLLCAVALVMLPGCASNPSDSRGKKLKTVSSLVEVDMGDGEYGLLRRKEVDVDDYNHDMHANLKGLDEPPRIMSLSPPRYPAGLKEQKVEGYAKLVFVVDEKGSVVSAKVKESSRPEFGLAAVQAVLHWKYIPMKKNNVPTKVAFSQVFNFSMK